MNRLRLPILLLVAAVIAALPVIAAERASVPESLTWKTTDLYSSDDAWQKARADLAGRIPGLAQFKGRLGASPESLYTAVNTALDVARTLQRLYVYASMRSDEDTRDQGRMAMNQAAQTASLSRLRLVIMPAVSSAPSTTSTSCA